MDCRYIGTSTLASPHAEASNTCQKVWSLTPSLLAPRTEALLPLLACHNQVRREHYLRDDISSGTPLDPASDPAANKLAPDARHYLVVDTNVALSQVWHTNAVPYQ